MEKQILQMIERKNKKIKTDLYLQIDDIDDFFLNDEIEINLREGSTLYKSLFLIKGDIFPTPKLNNILHIKEIFLNYDNNVILKLYILAEIKENININIQPINKEISLLNNNLFQFLKKGLNLEYNYDSSVFIVKENDCHDFYKLYNFRDLKEYSLSKHLIDNLENNCLILINYYKNDNFTIILDKLSMIKILKEEEFFNIIHRYIDNDISGIFKVIDIESNYLILVDELKSFYKLKKNKFNLNFGQIIMITNFRLEEDEEGFKIIKISNDSVTYISSQNIYFKELKINKISAIKFYVKDFNKINMYNKISIENSVKEITKDEFFFVLETNINIYEYVKIEISLIHSTDNKFNKNYNYILYRGFLNKVNLVINNFFEKSYLYEFIYIDLYKDINKNNSISEIINLKDNKKYEFNIYDSFNSNNRRRINIINIPKQKILEESKEDIKFNNLTNSIQICKFINNSSIKLFGIFQIDDIKLNMKEMNDIFDDYYDDFGDIFSELINNKEILNLKDFVNNCIEKYKNCKLDKTNSHLLINFEEKITLSQYKTRLGYLICYYYNLKKDKNFFINELGKVIRYINMEIKNKSITLFQKLRIYSYYLKDFSISKGFHNLKLLFFEDYPSNNPYTLGNNLNIDEINNLNEFSRLFFPYLQIDSNILFNYYINETSYSFTLEPLFVMKYNLLKNYEEFFFVTRTNSDKYAYLSDDERITVINEQTLFKKEIYDDNVIDIDDIIESKNYALSISMEFRHEKNGHEKRQQKNGITDTPLFFSRDLKFEKIQAKIEEKVKGESGRIIERFIIPDLKQIKDLKTGLIYGELLDYKYYIQKDFKLLMSKKNEIDEREKSIKFQKKNKDKCKISDNVISDEDNSCKKSKLKNINKMIKAYEEIGFVVEGDRIVPKVSRESVRYYTSSDFFKEPIKKRRGELKNK